MKAKGIHPILRGISILMILFMALALVPPAPVAAASTAKPAGLGEAIAVPNGVDWVDPNTIQTQNDDGAMATLAKNQLSYYLQARQFGFAIPEHARIDGIEVFFRRHTTANNAISDKSVYLTTSDAAGALTTIGTEKTSPTWVANFSNFTHGTPSDKWGVAQWTAAQINDPNFGVRFQAVNTADATRYAWIDLIRITITYTEPTGTTLTVSSVAGAYGDTATLSAMLSPAVVGKDVVFTLNDTPACSGNIAANGTASCDSALSFDVAAYPGGVEASFAGAPGFLPSTGSADLTVNKRAITVTASPDTKVYDGTVDSSAEPEITSGSLVEGDTADWSQVFDSKNAGPNKVLTPSGTVSDGNNGDNYQVKFVDGAGTITKRPLTVSAVEDTKVYNGTTISTQEPTVTGTLAVGDTADWSQAFDTKHVGANKTITVNGTIEDGNGGGNYAVTYEEATGVINVRAITVSATGANKVYDGMNTSSAKPTITSGSLAVGDTAEWSQTYEDENAGTEKELTPTGTIDDGNGGKNYLVRFEAALGDITPRPLTVTAETDSKVYDGNPASDGEPTLTSGTLVEGDTVTWTQAFEDKHTGTLKTITPAGVVSDGNGGSNYAVEFISVETGSITPLAITVSAVPDSRVYDGTPDSDENPSVPAGALVGSDTPSFTQSFVDEHVGTSKTIKATGKVNDGNNGGNYEVAFVDATGTITQRRIVVTAALETKVYDGTPKSTGEPTITDGELAVGDTAEWTQAFENKHSGSRMIMPAGTVSDGNNGDNYYVVYQFVFGQITPRLITVSALEDTKVYDGTDSSAKKPEVTSGSLVSGDIADFWQGFENQHAGTGKLIRSWGTVSDGNGGQNYTITFENSEGVITPRPITVTAVEDTKVYDGTTSSDEMPTITAGTLAGVDTPGWTQRFEDKHVGTLKTLLPDGLVNDGNGGSNYLVNFVPADAGTITPRQITVKAVTDVKIYDGTTDSKGKPSVTSGSIATGDSATWSQTFEDANVGAEKKILAGGLIEDGNNGENYTVAFLDTLGIISPREITVTAVTSSKAYDGSTESNGEPTITDGTLASGDTADWMQRYEDENAGTGKKLSPGGEIEDGNNGGNYTVEFVTVETGAITPLPITVSAQDHSRVYDGTTVSSLEPQITSGAPVAGDTPAFTQAFATSDAGQEISINVSGRMDDGNEGGNYQVTTVPAKGNITARPLTVTAVTDTKVYDGKTTSGEAPEITSGTLAAGDSEDFFQTFDTKNVGTGKTITPDGEVDDGNNGQNYDVEFVSVSTGEITKLAITVTADAITKQFGEEDPALTYDISPALASGDTLTGALAREQGEAVGTYEILAGTLSAGANYDLTFVGADFIIVKADQVITVTQHAPAYATEGTTFEVAATSSSGLPVTYTSSGSCTNEGAVFTMTSNTGTCQVIFDQAGDDSYNAAQTVIEQVKAGVIAFINVFTPIIAK